MTQKPPICPTCKSNCVITDPESWEIVCSKCGTVISDVNQEMRRGSQAFNNTTKRPKDSGGTGMPTSLAKADMGLATVISTTNKDASGHEIEAAMLSTMHRLRVWDYRTQVHTSGDRNLGIAFKELHLLKDKLGLPESITEKSAYIYRKAQERGFVRGRSISAVITAAVYIACREAGIPKTLKEIAETNNTRNKAVKKAYRLIVSGLDIKIPTFDPIKCIAKVANKAVLNEKTKRQAIEVMNNVVKEEISAGKNPMGLAATVLYISCMKTGEHKSQRDIAKAAGITDVTLRSGFKNVCDKLQLNNLESER